MSTPDRFSRMLRSFLGAALLSMLASLAACATLDVPQRGFAGASAEEPSHSARWGFATIAEPSRSPTRGYASISQPPQSESWGFVQPVSEPGSTIQASRVAACPR
jgi:hypothetical protein